MPIPKEFRAIVTGASRGIGRSIALALAREGARLALVARDAGALREVAQACKKAGGEAVPVARDLSDPNAADGVVREALSALGGLDGLINNAGLYGGGAVGEGDLAAWDAVLQVNLAAVVHLTHHAMPSLRQRRNGAIITTASVSSKLTHGGGAIYCASKHGVLGFSNSLFEDVREAGIKVCAICPGYVNTDMAADSGIVPERAIQPEDVADTVLYVLSCRGTVCPTEIVLRPQRSPYPKKS
ncbi:MAG TPA: SDR family oxidoreductase [Myxococcota bacterium]|nr:SDR family oxidoreductase [Myxococcota bacterium]